jgi:hypothetical protein
MTLLGCGRPLIGRGGELWDPVCVAHRDGLCCASHELRAEASFDADGDTGFLLGVPHLAAGDAAALFRRLGQEQLGTGVILTEDLTCELRPFRVPREGDVGFGEAFLWPCGEGEDPVAMVWVFDDIVLSL